MEYKTLADLTDSPQAVYAAIGFVGFAAGYVLAKFSGKRKLELSKLETERVLAQEKTKQLETQIELGKNEHVVELKKLEYEESAKKCQKDLENDEKQRQYKLSLARELVELKPVIEQYFASLKTAQTNLPVTSEYLQKRQERATELVKGILDYCDENREGWAEDIAISSTDLFDDNTKKQIEAILNIEFPLSAEISLPELPSEVKKLIDIILE
jgi:hypothetical protein